MKDVSTDAGVENIIPCLDNMSRRQNTNNMRYMKIFEKHRRPNDV